MWSVVIRFSDDEEDEIGWDEDDSDINSGGRDLRLSGEGCFSRL